MSNNIKRLTIEQGSQEWLDLRCKYVTSTLSFKIRENIPDSAIQQFKGRAGKINEEYSKMGHSGEEQCRDYLRSIGHDILPEQATYIDTDKSMLTSIDGESSCKSILYEFKTCVSTESATYQKASKGIVPTSHAWQIQHSLAVTGHQRCLYVVCLLQNGTTGPLDKDSIKFIHVYPDKVMQAKIEERAKLFLEKMKNGTLEIPDNALPGNHFELVQEYKALKHTKDTVDKLLEEQRQKLIDIGVHSANGVKVIKCNGKKIIDYQVALTEIADKLTPDAKKIINESCIKHTRFTDDYFRVDLKKPIMSVTKLK